MPRAALLLLAAGLCRLEAPGAAQPVRVRVVDPQDAAVSGARVEARGPRRDVPARAAVTAADGLAELAVEPPVEITVSADGFEPARQWLSGAGGPAVTIHLLPAILRSSVDVVVRDEPGPATAVGGRLEIERTGARTVLDAVDQVIPGAFVTRRGVMGYGIATNGTGGISIRGIGESPNTGVLIIVDARPDFQGLMGHPLPDFYSLSDAGTVSVVEGPASVLYGSNAMGGVIEVKNWAPPKGIHTRLMSSFGSFYTGQHRLSHGGRFERGFYSLNAGLSHTRGERPSSAFRDQDGTLTAGYDLSRVWRASLQGRYGHFHVEDPGPVEAPLANSYARVGRGGFSANLDNTASRVWGTFRYYSSYGNHYITDGFRSTDRTTGFRVDQNFAPAPQLMVELGSDAVNYGGHARNVYSRLDYAGHDLTSGAGFARAQWLATRRLRLHSGVRYQYDSQFGSIGAPEFGASYAIAEGYTLSAEIAKGFRNPTIRELYLFPAPNPSLRPEHIWNYQTSLQAHPVDSLTASLTAYYASLGNLIVLTGRFPNLRLQNLGAALNRGIETTVRWRARKRLTFQSGYAYLRSTNLAPYIPANKYTYGMAFDAGRVFVYFGGVSVGQRWADPQHSCQLGPYTLGTLKTTISLNRQWRLFAMADNLFSQSYQVVPGYPMPGLNAACGFTVSF